MHAEGFCPCPPVPTSNVYQYAEGNEDRKGRKRACKKALQNIRTEG